MKYRVIWFDDVFDDLEMIHENALVNCIELVGFKNAKVGISELEKNYAYYDAVILDGLFFSNPDQTHDSVSDKAISEVARFLDQLITKKVLPWFILSGQQSFTKEKNKVPELYEKRVYDKLNDADISDLWNDIKIEASKNIENQIRFDNKDVFSIFEKGYLKKEIEIQLIDVIRIVIVDNKVDIKGCLPKIRAIQESIYNALKGETFKIIPENMHKFNEINKYLNGNPDPTQKYKPTTEIYQNASISYLSETLYWVSGEYIHNIQKQDYHISNYTVKSLLYNLMELLLWFKGIADKHHNK